MSPIEYPGSPLGRTVIERLLVELLVNADANTIDERCGNPLLRETAIVSPDRVGGVPVLVLL